MTISESNLKAWSHPLGTARLRDIALFGALSDDTLQYLASSLRTEVVEPGTEIFREGDAARSMYVVLAGEMEVMKKSRQGRDTRMALLGPSDCFGEMSLIDMQKRSATIRALSASHLLRLSAEDLDALYRHDVKGYALLVLNIARNLSRRLRVTDALLSEVAASMSIGLGGRRP